MNKFMIGPISEGLRKDSKAAFSPEDSYEILMNAYQFRGRVVRKPGYTLLGRLQTTFTGILGNTDLAGNFLTNLVALLGLGATATVVPGSFTITIGNQVYTEPNPPDGSLLETIFPGPTVPAAPGTFINYITSVLGIVTNPPLAVTPVNITFSYTLNLPVMGLRTRELFGINQESLIAFDTKRAYLLSISGFDILPSIMPVTFNGTNYNFFWTINYANAFWATNSKSGIHGWSISSFANSIGVGTAATVEVTSPGNTADLGDTVYFLRLAGAASANNLIFATVIALNVGGNPNIIRVQALAYPDGINNFVDGNVTGFMLDSMQSISGQDGIRYYANISNFPPAPPIIGGNSWVNYNPPIDTENALCGALLIFAYRGYLVFLNTTEGVPGLTQNFPNRARWTQIGTPYYSNPVPNTPNLQTFDIFSVRDDLFGRGGANDAPTNESIVGAGFIRDILVVYFERSTWRLRFVNNSQNPFVWERVNVELGSSCTFASITFDKGLMTIGNRGIVISDGNDTIRFDEKIPDDIFDIRQANNGMERVNGIRTFKTKLIYWTFPVETNALGIFPDQILVYNYETKNWSYFDDTFTCFGYTYPTGISETWGDMTDPWNTYDYTWDSSEDSFGFETVIAGNQQGFVFELERQNAQNDPSLSISNIVGGIVTSLNHNIPDGTWITIENAIGVTSDDGVSLNGRNFKISNPLADQNNFRLTEFIPINGGNASGAIYLYQIGYIPIIPGSVQINVGALEFIDTDLDGILYVSGVPLGTINYATGTVVLNFSPPIPPTQVNIRIVSYSNQQLIDVVNTIGTYNGNGIIIRISNFQIKTKIFNFFGQDQRARLSKIDFYVDDTQHGEFTCEILADSGTTPINAPLPDNLQSNVVKTSQNPYQFGSACQETIYRLYCDAIAQSIQVQLSLSDRQIAVDEINSSNFQLLAMIFSMKKGGRLV